MEPLKHYLFIDIETASCEAGHEHLSEGMQREWAIKAGTKWKCETEDLAAAFFDKAGILAEFGRIVCISMGCLVQRDGAWKLVVTSFREEDEEALLKAFCASISRFYERHPDMKLVGHNIIEFDLPFISRRMIVHRMCLPKCLNFQGKKPWEVKDLVCDTMQIWSFGDYKSYTKLSLLAEVLGIETPKDDINGADVTRVFWLERDTERIVTYCQKDVATTARVYMRLMCYEEVDFSVEIMAQKVPAV